MLQGLSLSLTGIVVTFASLGLFILIIVLLQRFFGARQDDQPTAKPTGSVSLPDSMSRQIDEEVVVAIAIAINHFRSLDAGAGDLGASLEQGPGPWWSARQFPSTPPRKAK